MIASERPIVAICRLLPAAGRDELAVAYDVREGGRGAGAEQWRELVAGASAIVADPTVPIDRDLLEAAGPDLRIVANFAVGYDNVDLDACTRRGVAVTNTPDVLTNATAELALALTLEAARGLGFAEREVRAGRWQGWSPDGYVGTELSGASFGIVGMGRIGRRYAELVRPMAGEVVYSAPTVKHDAEDATGARHIELDEMFERAAVISLHVPATPRTSGLIGEPELRAMREDAILVNTARGALVEEAALVRALHEGWIAAAGLDVYEAEPSISAELLAAPNCVLLPHIGSATKRARDGMAILVAHNVRAALEGERLPNRVA